MGKLQPKDPIERFMNFVEFEPNTGCWLWSGSCFGNGYGKFTSGLISENTLKKVKAHRFSYETFVGPIPDGLEILHKCDVHPCVNWEHLFLGTRQDNSSDMALKGRGTKSKRKLLYGVSIQTNGRFSSRIQFKKKSLYLGTFDTIEEAGEVAFKKKLELINVR